MVGRSADELFSPDDQQNGEPRLEQLMAETQGRSWFSRWLCRKDGTQFLAEGTLRSLPGEMGEAQGFIKFFTDVTSRVQKYEDTIADMVTRAQDSGNLLHAMAHDMRQYTRGISTNCTMMIRDLANILPDEQKNGLVRLKENSQRMHEMVNGILDHLRVGNSPINPKAVNLSAVAEDAVQRVKATMPENDMHFIVQPGLWVKGDKELLDLVFGNLFENACKYGGGKVIFGHDAAKDAYYVRDEGPGFEQQYAEKIFKLFERLHGQDKPGTGIGLPNVKRIIERHGGKIWAEGEPGKGATFYFTLKAAEHAAVGSLR
jgi:signal transduction histidine kinase